MVTMVKLILGLKGSGKTKRLVELVREAVACENGDVVCIEKEKKLTFDIPYQARLIEAGSYSVGSYEFIRGFICGLHSGNYDITHIYIDPVFKMCGRDFEAFTQMVNKLDSLRATQDVQIIFTLSCEPEDLPYHLRDMMIENW